MANNLANMTDLELIESVNGMTPEQILKRASDLESIAAGLRDYVNKLDKESKAQ